MPPAGMEYLPLSGIAARKVSNAEPATVSRVLRTMEELEQRQFNRGRADGLSDCDSVDVSAFKKQQLAPSRLSVTKAQAIPAEPFMLNLLEQTQNIACCHRQWDTRWAAFLDSWVRGWLHVVVCGISK